MQELELKMQGGGAYARGGGRNQDSTVLFLANSTIPLILTGLRLQTTTTKRSLSSSRGTNLARPLTTVRNSEIK